MVPIGVSPAANGGQGDPAALEEEVGDLLLALVNLTRWLKIDPELALRAAVRKFAGRFQRMEKTLQERGEDAGEQTPARWRALWCGAKEAAEP